MNDTPKIDDIPLNSTALEVNDETVMWFGKYKGKRLADVPASYLLWCYDQNVQQDKLGLYTKRQLRSLRREAEDELLMVHWMDYFE